jgi:drug/metabolite transporter (DMT)-like permease
MIYLLLSIISSTGIMLTFKGFNRIPVDTFKAIVVNYLVCAVIGLLIIGDWQVYTDFVTAAWLPHAVALGILFIGGFYIISLTAQYIGATAAAISNKLSVVVPVVAAFFLYGDSLPFLKLVGILFALVGLYCSSVRKHDKILHLSKRSQLLLPILVFLIGGIIDTTIKYVQEYYLPPEAYHNFVTWLFGTAFICGLFTLFYQMATREFKINTTTVWGGVLLGLFNYGSIYFLVEALNLPGWESSAIFPINHVGIVCLAAVGAFILFRERLSKLNLFGLFSAVAAIVCIYVAKMGYTLF